MKDTIKSLFGSKKFIAALSTILGLIAVKALGWDISEETLATVIGAIGAIYIAAQGAADHGKEAKAIEAEVIREAKAEGND